MRIEKNGNVIVTVDDWHRHAPPKRPDQWAAGFSALELARAWCEPGGPSIPGDLHSLLESFPLTTGMAISTVHPELPIPFDSRKGETRNADLAFVGRAAGGLVAVTVEAKVNESFGDTIADTFDAALERRLLNPRSSGAERIVDLVSAILQPRSVRSPRTIDLRYQLLTATAGSIAFAVKHGASAALLIVHEFRTQVTNELAVGRNGEDYHHFLHRIGETDSHPSRICGPFAVPGAPLFQAPPPLYVGKVVTERRQ